MLGAPGHKHHFPGNDQVGVGNCLRFTFTTGMKEKNNQMLKYASLATQWMVLLGIAVWGGHKLDVALHLTVPAFLIVFPVIALVVSLVGIIKEFNKK